MKLVIAYIQKMRGGKQVPPRAPLDEIFWSAFGGFLGIYLIYILGHYNALNMVDSLFLVGSFGASAVLLYGAPKSPYAQPRNLVGGHIISAFIGVTCALLLNSQPEVAAATAVSLSLVFMHLSRTVHPPGGATALIAVIGSDKIHQMAYWYVLSPISTGAIIMLLIAVLVNNLSPYRRYPEYWF
jgi:CBS-domain-containing membrane protein